MASVLVTSGALSVLAIPVITSFFRVAIAAHPVEAAREVAERPEELRRIIQEHQEHAHEVAERFHEERRELRRRGVRLSSADFLAQESEPKTRASDGEQTQPDDLGSGCGAGAALRPSPFHELGICRDTPLAVIRTQIGTDWVQRSHLRTTRRMARPHGSQMAARNAAVATPWTQSSGKPAA